MKIDMRKATLAALTGFCFWVAGERIHDFYIENAPIGREGSCYYIQYPGLKGNYQMQIFKNDLSIKSSMVMIELIPYNGEGWSDTYTFFQLRMLNPKSMECL